MVYQNVKAIQEHKSVKGVKIAPTAFFAAWGIWNLYYWFHLGQWISWFSGMGILIINTWWVYLAIYYTYKDTIKENKMVKTILAAGGRPMM